jgi:hypothetical protein
VATTPSRPTVRTARQTVHGLFLALTFSCAGELPGVPGTMLHAQGVTTGAIAGTVRTPDGSGGDGARVRVVNVATGVVLEGETRQGRFQIHGIPVGGPYIVTVGLAGYASYRTAEIRIGLAESVELLIVLEPAPIRLDTMHVAAKAPFQRSNTHGGAATVITDSLLQRLPTMNRNLYDFVRLAPQITTRIGFAPGGMSGGGVGFRFNNFLIDGVAQRSVPGNQPPEFAGARSLPFEAVSAYQVLVAPFDVRYGDFAGALVNAVTRSGTNELRGSVFASARNDGLARGGGLGGGPYERRQFGFAAGGPVRRDRVHFFVASEIQQLTWPAPGPFVGQRTTAGTPVPVAEADIARLDDIMRRLGMVAGSGGPVRNRNPLMNVFTRVDATLPGVSSRAVLTANDGRTTNLAFSRPPGARFFLTSHMASQKSRVRTASLQLHTSLRRTGGGHNELIVAYRSARAKLSPAVRQPIVMVTVPGATGGATTIVTGTPVQAHGSGTGYRAVSIADHVTLPLGASHVATFGIDAERFRVDRHGLLNAFGTWAFSSLDSLEAGIARSYEVARDLGAAAVPIEGTHLAAYVGNRWRPGERLSLTLGVRAELLAIHEAPPYNPGVDSIFGRRTDAMPSRSLHLSPRIGFTWDLTGAQRDQLRGGAGVFTGRPPIAWFHSAFTAHGAGTAVLRCGQEPTSLGPAPEFDPGYRNPPAACADGAGLTSPPPGHVDLLDRRLRMAQTLRAVLAYDRRLPGDLLGTIEVVATRNLSDFVFVNLNLGEPRGIDGHGRVVYGNIDPSGIARPGVRDDAFPSVSELRNTSRNRSSQISTRLEKRFSDGVGGTAFYTYARARDVQTPLRVNVQGMVNWSSRAVSGRHDDLRPGISLNDVPHRIVLAGTYRAPWRRWSTNVSLLYVGEAGSPFTYTAWGAEGRGDLNADGSTGNDPIYVPRNALDPDEILISGRSDVPDADNSPDAQAERELRRRTALEAFIERAPCLRGHRGRILPRNACREPWTHTTIASLRQTIPFAGRGVEAQLDVFNLLDVLNRRWGHHRQAASPQLLEHVGQTPEGTVHSRPIFRFDEGARQWMTLSTESSFQIQVALRYRF